MDLISEFISRYRKEYDFYEQACRMASQVLEANLQSAGIRAIVTSRAKNPIRLEAKVRHRAQTHEYKSVDDIFADIVDLAGMRVALYFPAERSEVGRMIQRLFVVAAEPKEFPTASKPSHEKRFSGYWATHYRVRIPETLLNESQKRYAEAPLEIQVASVLMHAWSEVEHDLVYKPLQGELSEDEYAVLDELNGLVLAGEIALERLQRAGKVRVSSHDREYTSHYDLASSLLEMSRAKLVGLDIHDSSIGRVDLLFLLLRNLRLNKPGDLTKYIEALHADFEKRPLAEQIIDQILSEDPTRYAVYEDIRAIDLPTPTMNQADLPRASTNQASGQFMSLWVIYEKILREIGNTRGYKSLGMPSSKFLATLAGNAPDLAETHERLRQFRNQLVHGGTLPDANFIDAQISMLKELIDSMKTKFNLPEKPPSYESRDLEGVVSFDYSNNNGRFLIGTDDMSFETAWSAASNTSIHAYNDPASIETIAIAVGAARIEDIIDARSYDTSSRTRTPQIGQILVWKNTFGYFLATKIESVSARSHGADKDEVTFSYKIAHDKGWAFW